MTLRYITKCGETWMACSAQARKGELGLDQKSGKGRLTTYQYLFYGSVKYAEPFSDSYIIQDSKDGQLLDFKKYLGKNLVFEFLEDTHVFGFTPGVITGEDGQRKENSINDWDGKIITKNGVVKIEKQSILVCLGGSPVVNGKTLTRYDYDESTSKTYTIDLKTDGVLVLFTQI